MKTAEKGVSMDSNDERIIKSRITPEEAHKFFEFSSDVFGITDLQGRPIKFNRAVESQNLETASLETVLSVAEYAHPDDKQRVIDHFQAIASGQDVPPLEIRCLQADGTYKWISWSGVAVPEENRVYSIGRDVSLQKAAELRSRQLAAIVEHSSDAIVGIDVHYNITAWNMGAEAVFGVLSADAIGKKIDRIISNEEFEAIKQALDARRSVEIVCNRGPGRMTFGAAVFSSVLDESGRIAGYSLIVRDITEKKAVERRLREFCSTVSHELRTPLTSIRGVLGLLSSGVIQPDSAEAKELLDVAQQSSDRLLRLINDILDVQKIESGKMEFNPRSLDANMLVANCIAQTAGMAEEFKVSVLAEVNDGPREVHADEDRTMQILVNLVSNAIKFSPEGSKVVLRTSAHRTGLRFSVRDFGTGVPEDQAYKLFGQFQQLDSSDTRKVGGTGLGLSICKALAERQNGRIGFYNESVGCTFWFELPRPADVENEDSKEDRKHILIVEDDRELAFVMSKHLGLSGYRVTVVGDVAGAQAFLDRQTPDGILLDLKLPDGNGRDILAYMVRSGKQAVPVIVVSGSESKSDIGPLVVDWIAKPFDNEQLVKALSSAIKDVGPKLVALIDDDDHLRKVMSAQLASVGIRSVQACDGMEAIEVIDKHRPDLLVLDIAMPRLDGFGVVEALRKTGQRLPLILYSGLELHQTEIENLRLGNTICLTKGKTSDAEFVHSVLQFLHQRGSPNMMPEYAC